MRLNRLMLYELLCFLQLISWLLIAVGVWAHYETTKYQGTTEVDSITDIIFNFSLMFIIVGSLIFILAFLGTLGSLRENTFLLKTVSKLKIKYP